MKFRQQFTKMLHFIMTMLQLWLEILVEYIKIDCHFDILTDQCLLLKPLIMFSELGSLLLLPSIVITGNLSGYSINSCFVT